MSIYTQLLRAMVAALAVGLFLPVFSYGNTIYTYTSGSVNVTFDATINTDSLPAGTNITSDLVAGSFSMTYPAPPSDEAGFPLGSGSQYDYFTLSAVKIGTDSAGGILSWDITGTQFASYPAIAAENPNDFYCTYSVSFTQSGSSAPLATDNDAGFCPGSDNTAASGSWNLQGAAPGAVPEPCQLSILGGGLVAGLTWLRRRKLVG